MFVIVIERDCVHSILCHKRITNIIQDVYSNTNKQYVLFSQWYQVGCKYQDLYLTTGIFFFTVKMADRKKFNEWFLTSNDEYNNTQSKYHALILW